MTAPRPPARLGVDIGGTFTDVALETAAGRFTTKVATTAREPEAGVMEAIGRVLAEAGIAPGDLTVVIHGTTLATNAIIERKGAKTALITTDGFRDVLEIATEGRFDVYDVNLDLPQALVPRDRRLEAVERISARGDVLIPLDEAGIHRLIDDKLRPARVEAVAVGFMHGYANPAHEERVGAILAERLPGVSVTLSSAVSPEMREHERFTTATANAYVQPLMSRYLGNLGGGLADAGIRCPLYLMTSGGGLTTLETAIRFPVRLVESGPAGGAIFAGDLARGLDIRAALSFDMGGTTAKICLVDDGASQTARSFEVARVYRFKKGSGLPLRIPVIEMVEIGAGGGSIAAVDALGRIAVGPESSGSEPGPVCYGRGGGLPTVTDADLSLGRLDPDRFAGGDIRLDEAAARAALDREIGKPLSLDTTEAAFGIAEVVDTNMANAARVHAVESGKNAAERTLIAFGGAAPLHAARVAAKLGIDHVVVPAAAGVGSCVGFLRAPVAFEIVRSFYQNLAAFDAAAVNRVLGDMRDQAAAEVRAAAPDATLSEARVAYMRYAGQGSEVAVTLPAGDFDAAAPQRLKALFETAYRAQYTHAIPGAAVEVISWSVTVATPAPTRDELPAAGGPGARPAGRRRLFQPETGAWGEADVYWRPDLGIGTAVAGPALIAEPQTTTVVPPGFTARVHCLGHLLIDRDPEGSPP